jgi:hypothetical protein
MMSLKLAPHITDMDLAMAVELIRPENPIKHESPPNSDLAKKHTHQQSTRKRENFD